jgi:hypothetical protein
MNIEAIKPDLMVHAKGGPSMHGAAGVHVGTVDHLEDNRWIKLKKDDSSDGRHHWIPTDWVVRADDKAIYVDKTPAEFRQGMESENPVGVQ